MKIINGNRQGHYALFTGELVRNNLEMNYFELKYGKYFSKKGKLSPEVNLTSYGLTINLTNKSDTLFFTDKESSL